MDREELLLMLLCCKMGDRIVPLTAGQYLALQKKAGAPPAEPDRILSLCGPDSERERLAARLSREAVLSERLCRWHEKGVEVCTLLSPDYPRELREKLGEDAPAALFLLGDRSLLAKPAVSLVGSRNLREENRRFAEARGAWAAARGLTLCSGDARGADRAGQEGCLHAGGAVLSFVADRLLDRRVTERCLYASEDGPDYAFSSARALARNRLIHAKGRCVFVAQTEDGRGGTWSGTYKNLTRRWSPVYCYEDGTVGMAHLCREGAKPFSAFREEQYL